ncbi:hypothetical protein [Trinickia symbiotica]|uniref:hypothetical protein n=1 Tax=Trinickia symbiotica TaxID=863227 RepID=UPI0011AF3320|nr:hypothetical protein [Trinickia symbiotica]
MEKIVRLYSDGTLLCTNDMRSKYKARFFLTIFRLGWQLKVAAMQGEAKGSRGTALTAAHSDALESRIVEQLDTLGDAQGNIPDGARSTRSTTASSHQGTSVGGGRNGTASMLGKRQVKNRRVDTLQSDWSRAKRRNASPHGSVGRVAAL